MYIFYFFTHVETYTISNKSLNVPRWLPRTRYYWMIANLIVGNTLNIVTFALQRTYLIYLLYAWVGAQSFCVAVVLGGVAWRLTQTVARVFGKQYVPFVCALSFCSRRKKREAFSFFWFQPNGRAKKLCTLLRHTHVLWCSGRCCPEITCPEKIQIRPPQNGRVG